MCVDGEPQEKIFSFGATIPNIMENSKDNPIPRIKSVSDVRGIPFLSAKYLGN